MKLIFSSLTLDLERLCLHGPAGQIRLRPKSFEVLRYLAEHAGRALTKDELIAAIWPDVTVSEESLTRCISDIRLAIGDDAQRIIKTLPKRGYLLEGPVSRDGKGAGPLPRSSADFPAIAVLAFANLSQDSSQDYFCEGIIEDIITELSRFSGLLVIARNSSFQYKGRSVDVRQIGNELGARYILEGSIQSNDGTVRITAQLIDAARGAHLWADRFDRKLGDTFSIQDEIARMISVKLAIHIDDAEAHRPLAKPTANWDAYDYFLRGNHMMKRLLTGPVEELYEARKLLERSIELDPAFARPYAALSTTYTLAWINPVNHEHQSEETLQRALELARKAVELGPNEPFGYGVLANAAMFQRDRAACLAAWDRVFALNPNYCDWRYGQCLVLFGKPEEGLAALRRYMRLDPFFPPQALMTEGLAHFVQRRYEEALAPFREMVDRAPNFRNGRMLLAAAYGHLGKTNEAGPHIAALLRIEPDCTLKKLSGQRYLQSAEGVLHYLDGLRKAGLPEG
ncbi:winged helix-turn-helix domain-containing protein [Bradyrhizobium sp. Bra78]|uniref:winged helix-turn-helix domain-containing protein n=1 Tax=Bradyrhizobium sp. Bra78 TaxID=2926010 RepID=UPI0021C77A8E|nr:winged helix-turn-helix domain-containing protein [Bradyrhizobium sp. Bra78]